MSAGEETERHGREYVATVRFCLPVDATDEQIDEFVQFELGGGSCQESNPLLNSGLSRVEVEDVSPTGWVLFTDWGPWNGNRRSGHNRRERAL